MTKYLFAIVPLFFSAQLFANEANYEKGDKPLPKWELGGVAAGFFSPLYPASKDDQSRALVVPYAVYRGEKIRIGDGAIIKAMAVEAPKFKVDVSLAAAFNANADDSDIREGMDDLDFLFEIGPQFRFLLSENSIEYGAEQELWLNVQTRAVFSTDFSELSHRGYTFQPQLSWRGKNMIWQDTISFASIAPVLATEKLHDYFYQVNNSDVTEFRSEYDATSGYLGTKVSIGKIFQIKPEISVFFAAQLGLWQGSANENSPLFEVQNNISAALGIRYTFFKSAETI